LDFRNVTDLFADKDFDGDPIRVKPVSADTDLTNVINEEENDDQEIIDSETGQPIPIKQPVQYKHIETSQQVEDSGYREKVFVNGVDVSVLVSREMYFDLNGKPITTSLKDHTKELIQGRFSSLDDFLNEWMKTERKEILIKELEEQGVLVSELSAAVNREVDLFDLICHVAFDQPPLTRRERANNVKKRNYFTKYGEQSRKVLEALLEKYADEGITNIESMDVLKVKPLDEFGGPLEIISQFGGKGKYMEAIKDLENELYKTGS